MKPWLVVLVLAALLLASPASALVNPNVTKVYTLDNTTATPFVIWVGAILLGLMFVLISFLKLPYGAEALVSVFAWVPICFAMFTSFAVDRVTSTGFATDALGNPVLIESHSVGAYPTIAVILLVFLAFAVGNTWRITVNQAREQVIPEKSWSDGRQPRQDADQE